MHQGRVDSILFSFFTILSFAMARIDGALERSLIQSSGSIRPHPEASTSVLPSHQFRCMYMGFAMAITTDFSVPTLKSAKRETR